MIRLRELCAPAVALEWHEAVAVVAALTATVWNARLAHAPTLDAAVLTIDGDVAVVNEARLPGPVTTGLAFTLGALLETTPCPAELRHIVTANAGPEPELDSVNAFSRALMFFERPSRQEVLCQLAARATRALEQVRASEELERLTERARQRAEESQPSPPREAAAPIAASSARRLAPAAVAITVFVGVALVAATLFTKAQARRDSAYTVTTAPVEDDEATPTTAGGRAAAPASPATSTPTAITETPPGAATRTTSPTGASPVRTSGGASAAPASASTPPVSASPTRVAPPAPAHGAAPGAPATREPNVVVRVTELGGAPLPPVAALSTGSANAGRLAGTRVYTASDPGVQPAVLVKPHLPAEPPSDVPPWEVGTLELTISTAGTVDQVHLISPYNRYQERMLVAAAKAWIFQPAMREGRPVRFRARIRVTL